MTAWTRWHPPDRSSRHVRRVRLRLSPGGSRERLASMLEESLRLASLPGEDQGRVYYFRRLRVAGLPADGDRTAWLAGFQHRLSEQAAYAAHGADPAAASASAVYFASDQEACEILLRRILERRPLQDWFWPSVLAPESEPSAEPPGRTAIPSVIGRLRLTPASWMTVAETVFAVLTAADPVYLLQFIPVSAAETWLQEIGGWQPEPRHAPQASLPGRTLPAIERTLQAFGGGDPRTEWLAALAVILGCPSDLGTGTAVARARLALRSLGRAHPARDSRAPTGEGDADLTESPEAAAPPAESPPGRGEYASGSPRTGSDVGPAEYTPDPPAAGPLADLSRGTGTVPAPTLRPDALPPFGPSVAELFAHTEAPVPAQPLTAFPQPRASVPDLGLPPELGLPTEAGGLFFLLNALARVGIAQAMEGGLGWAHPHFVARVLFRLAMHAAVDKDDPAVAWIAGEAEGEAAGEAASAQPETATVPCDPAWWPANLPPWGRDACSEAYLVRAWCLAARRWCWRTGRIPAAEVVRREALWSVNRTDLDVTLAMDTIDIRVRRIGLDLDPGWLPWFGRVVRFHYRYRGEAHV